MVLMLKSPAIHVLSWRDGQTNLFIRAVVSVLVCVWGCSSEPDCSAVTCVVCPAAVEATLVDPAGAPLELDEAPVLVGISGSCSKQGVCQVPVHDSLEQTNYEFEIVLDDEVIAVISETVPRREAKGCCDCGYTSKQIEVKLRSDP